MAHHDCGGLPGTVATGVLHRSLRSLAGLVVGGTIACAVPGGTAGATVVDPDGDPTALLDEHAPVLAAREQVRACGDGEPFRVLGVDDVLGRDDVVLRDGQGRSVTSAPSAAEMVQLVFDTTSLDDSRRDGPVLCAYAQHVGATLGVLREDDGSVAPRTADAVERIDGIDVDLVGAVRTVDDRAVVFVAQGSHSSHVDRSLWLGRGASSGFGCEDATSALEVIRPAADGVRRHRLRVHGAAAVAARAGPGPRRPGDQRP